MNELIQHCENVMKLLDTDYPQQRHYAGIVKDLYALMRDIAEHARRHEIYASRINFSSIARQLADDSFTQHNSPIFDDLYNIEKLLQNLSF